MDFEIENKVANSGLISLDLEDYKPKHTAVHYDIAQHLWQGIAIKELDFRAQIKAHDWQQYTGKHIAVYSSEDAIIPLWVYMLLASKLSNIAASIYISDTNRVDSNAHANFIWQQIVNNIDWSGFKGAKVVVKGCSNDIPKQAYTAISTALMPIASSIMFGEPCSTVPIYKQPKPKVS